jgi:hypothetical protein
LGSWIESFIEYTEELESAPVWRQWAGIATIASALERKVWIKTNKGILYPNLYTLLVGHAGTGKTITIRVGEGLLRELEDPTGSTGLHIAPTSMTMASMVDEMAKGKRSILRPMGQPPVEFHALTILADELSALIHQYDHEIMAGLTTLYDGGMYAQTRRGKDIRIKIPNPCLNLLAGTTPSFLCQFMPEGAWDQGFASRIVLVYSGDRTRADLFEDHGSADEADYRDLLHDLRMIDSLYGQMELEDDMVAAFREWQAAGETPVPTHPKLTHYCSRRRAHLLKLCIVAAVSRGNGMRVSRGDFDHALAWLTGAELTMPDVFTAGITGGDSQAIEEVYHFVWAYYAKLRRGVPDHELVHFVRERVPSNTVLRVIEIMERDKTIVAKLSRGVKTYEPGPKRPRE